ncbi:MAG: signal peptidase I, partial [Chloroflexota bacterium]|nr:signal peptidase I [Chloroflexota bacterium]
VRELIETLLLTVVIFFGVRLVVQSFRVDGPSMLPNLHTNQLVIVNKALYWHISDDGPLAKVAQGPDTGLGHKFVFRAPRRGEVIVFRAPLDPDRDYIKRVIGVPGDTVEIRDGKVWVNGKRLHEPYLSPDVYTEASGEVGSRVTVPQENLFVLGDNRPGSSDSRDWGFVPLGNVIGKAMFIYWPVRDWGGIAHAWIPSTFRWARLAPA